MGNQQSSSVPIDAMVHEKTYEEGYEDVDTIEGFATNVISTENVCKSGNSGFPILVSQFTKTPTNTVIEAHTNNKLSLQFSKSKRVYKLNSNSLCAEDIGNSTFIYDGDQYNVTDLCLRRPGHTNLANNTPMGEVQLWGTPTTGGSKSNYVVLIIPFYGGGLRATPNKSGEAVVNILQGKQFVLEDIVPSGRDVRYYTYSTCLETKDGRNNVAIKTVSVAYWETCAIIPFANDPDTLKRFTYGCSAKTFRDVYPLVSFTTNADGSKQNPVYTTNVTNGSYEAYTIPPLTADSFKTRFRLYTGFVHVPESRGAEPAYAKNYKCIPLNPTTDVVTDKNGDKRIIIDPTSGEQLDKELLAADQALRGAQAEASISAAQIGKWVVIVIGSILGLMLLVYVTKLIIGMVQKSAVEEVILGNTSMNSALNTAKNTAKNLAKNANIV